jgi:hypothetical protein
MKQIGMKRNPESGFALLFIYAMAATVAIMLFMELPRVAFEAQRDKEQLLIDRGEQYSRAVNLFVRKFNRYPADFDALQNTQNLRFLRHKFTDPMTGKDEWRIIHVGPGGVFTDSLVYGKKDDKKQADQQNFIAEMQQTGGNQVDATQSVNIGTRQRPSDQPGAAGDPNSQNYPNNQNNPGQLPPLPQFDANGQPVPNVPGTVPGQPPNPQPGIPGQFQPGANGFPNGMPPGFQPPGQPFPGQSPFPGQPFPGMPGQVGGAPGQPQGGPPTAAGNLIGQLLTTPRPGGLNGLGGVQQGATDPNAIANQNANGLGTAVGTLSSPTGTATPTPAAGQTIGGGMAGVASKREQEGIKIYKEQKSYHKWEFVYDITKDPARTGGAVPQGAPPPGTPIGGGPPGTPFGGQPPGTQPLGVQPGAQPGALPGTPGANGMPSPNGGALPAPPQTPFTPQ